MSSFTASWGQFSCPAMTTERIIGLEFIVELQLLLRGLRAAVTLKIDKLIGILRVGEAIQTLAAVVVTYRAVLWNVLHLCGVEWKSNL